MLTDQKHIILNQITVFKLNIEKTAAVQIYVCQRHILSFFPAAQRGILIVAGFFHDPF